MSDPRHHPPEDVLLAYAAGSATEAVSLLVATHLALCPGCRVEVSRLERIGGTLLESAAIGSEDAGLEALLARLDQPVPAPVPAPTPPQPDPGFPPLPEPLRSFVGALGSWSWRTLVPGMAASIPLSDPASGTNLRLVRLRGGSRVPHHTHEGPELNLILSGGFTDRGEDYRRGDVSAADDEVQHHLDIHRGEPCIVLVVNEGPLVPLGLWGRLLGRIAGEL